MAAWVVAQLIGLYVLRSGAVHLESDLRDLSQIQMQVFDMLSTLHFVCVKSDEPWLDGKVSFHLNSGLASKTSANLETALVGLQGRLLTIPKAPVTWQVPGSSGTAFTGPGAGYPCSRATTGGGPDFCVSASLTLEGATDEYTCCSATLRDDIQFSCARSDALGEVLETVKCERMESFDNPTSMHCNDLTSTPILKSQVNPFNIHKDPQSSERAKRDSVLWYSGVGAESAIDVAYQLTHEQMISIGR